jgi:hypothetical protein
MLSEKKIHIEVGRSFTEDKSKEIKPESEKSANQDQTAVTTDQ